MYIFISYRPKARVIRLMIFPEGFSPRKMLSLRVNILPNHPSGESINDILYGKYITV